MSGNFKSPAFPNLMTAIAYLSPLGCSSPHLNQHGISGAKTVGTRLRAIHSNDEQLLLALNEYSGYMIARGYKEVSWPTDQDQWFLMEITSHPRSFLFLLFPPCTQQQLSCPN